MLEEVAYACYPPIHEGRRPSYGCVMAITEDLALSLVAGFGRVVDIESGCDIAQLRILCNGRRSFLVRTPSGPLAIVELASGDELSLVRALPQLPALGIQRLPSGVVKVFGTSQVFLREAEEWSVKPYAHLEVPKLLEVAIPGSSVVGSALLDVSLHLLSARHVGATLVWILDGASGDLIDRLARRGDPPAVRLNVTDPSHPEMLASVLAAMDGAAIVEADGTVSLVGAHLAVSDRSTDLLSPEHGTRHTSAKRFSFDVPCAIAFVVSQDGPVTVFSDGISILQLARTGSYRSSIVAHNPQKAEAVSTRLCETRCSRCEKSLLCEVTTFEEWNELESVPCPVCGEKEIASFQGVDVRVLPIKPWRQGRHSSCN